MNANEIIISPGKHSAFCNENYSGLFMQHFEKCEKITVGSKSK